MKTHDTSVIVRGNAGLRPVPPAPSVSTVAQQQDGQTIPPALSAAAQFLLILFLLSASSPIFAQEPLPPAPEKKPSELQPPPVPATSPPPPAAAPHRFFHKENKWLFAGVAATRTLDFASTKNFRSRGRDEILLNNAVVDNTPAFVAVQAGGVATSIGLSYLFHRAGHHKLERWVSILHIGVTTFGVTRNFMLKTRHPAPATP